MWLVGKRSELSMIEKRSENVDTISSNSIQPLSGAAHFRPITLGMSARRRTSSLETP